jgi:Ca2+-binding EF-hand superfamily protein
MVESTQPKYDVSFELKKHFTPQEITELQHAFKCYDTDKNGTMDMKEFKQVLKDLGKRDVTEEQVNKMMDQHDQNKDSVLSWQEFLEMFKELKLQNGEQFAKVMTIKAGEVS